jgi:hypothetical protein
MQASMTIRIRSAVLAAALILAALVPAPPAGQVRAAEPGTVQLAIYYGTYGEFVPLHAKVGQAALAQPKVLNAVCQTWSYGSAVLDNGSLPPGMAIDNGVISGAPEAPGTWVVSIKFTGILCNGTGFPDQETDVPIQVR